MHVTDQQAYHSSHTVHLFLHSEAVVHLATVADWLLTKTRCAAVVAATRSPASASLTSHLPLPKHHLSTVISVSVTCQRSKIAICSKIAKHNFLLIYSTAHFFFYLHHP